MLTVDFVRWVLLRVPRPILGVHRTMLQLLIVATVLQSYFAAMAPGSIPWMGFGDLREGSSWGPSPTLLSKPVNFLAFWCSKAGFSLTIARDCLVRIPRDI